MKVARTIVTAMAKAFAVAGLSLLLILAVFTLLDGLLRAIANTPIDLVREIGDMVAAICGTCCLPIVLLHQNNIVLRIFDRILPPSGVRGIDTSAALVIEIVMIGMAWQFWRFGIKTMRAATSPGCSTGRRRRSGSSSMASFGSQWRCRALWWARS